MATIITHPIVPLALGAGMGREKIPLRVIVAGVFLSAAPDLDVISFQLGIPYSHMLGHRGLSHSLTLALILAGFVTMMLRVGNERRVAVFTLLLITTASHGILDAMTNGGLGIAFFAPFSNERYFLPWQVLKVSPIGMERFLTPRGLAVMYSELIWVWIPAIAGMGLIYMVRRWKFFDEKKNN